MRRLRKQLQKSKSRMPAASGAQQHAGRVKARSGKRHGTRQN